MDSKVVIVGGIAALVGIALLSKTAGGDQPGNGTIDITVTGPDGQPVPQV